MNKVIKLMQMALIVAVTSVFLLSPIAVHADAKTAVCEGAGIVGGASGCEPVEGTKTVNDYIAIGLNVFSAIIGVAAVVMMMIGGIKYVTSQGDATQTNNAKNTILYAAIGLVVAAIAQIFVQFVLSRFDG